ncbi:hypothetical protein Tco_0735104 [Tanacetum coccineum]
MSEEDQNVETVLPVKSDMHSYSSTMTAKDVKALAFKHNIPLDLHPVALTAEWTMDKLPDDSIGLYEQHFEFSGVRVPFSTLLLAVLDHFRGIGLPLRGWVGSGIRWEDFFDVDLFPSLKGWKKRFFFLDRRAIPQAMAWRHHDSDIHDPLPIDGFRASDVVTLTNQSIDIRPVPSGLLFHAGLATTWEFTWISSKFQRYQGECLHVVGVSFLRFPSVWMVILIEQGDAMLKEVEIPDPKIIAIRERKASAAAKKRAERKRVADGEGGLKGKPKRRKVSAIRPEEGDSTEEASSASPLRTIAPNPPFC